MQTVLNVRRRTIRLTLLRHLEAGTPRPLTAIELAKACGILGSHESKRRRVRELISHLRERGGLRICASSGKPEDCGVWFARDDDEWRRYREARRNKAKFEFVAVRRMTEAVSERKSGQMRLKL